jgi:hypothetical protein
MSRISYTPGMVGFLIKKAFFDGWDNLLTLLVLNLGFTLLFGLGIVLPGSLNAPLWLSIALAALTLLLVSVWWSACVYALNGVADFSSFRYSGLAASFKASLAPGLQVGGFLAALLVVVSVGLPFYLSLGGFMGTLAAGVVFWCAVMLILALQYYIPVRSRLGGGFKKNLRKSFLLFLDNPGFSLFLLFYNLIGLAVSFFLVGLLPGLAGVALALDDALRLRLYKYDWLEAHPEGSRKEVPWDDLLVEDRELVGKRTLKGMFFPWKE